MFINLPVLLGILRERKRQKRAIIGEVVRDMKPVRIKALKHYVSHSQFKGEVLPMFTAGCAYVITGDLVHGLFKASLEKHFLKLEDVYITGMIARELKVTYLNQPEFWNRRVVPPQKCAIQRLATVQLEKKPENETFELWREVTDHSIVCAYKN